MACVMSEADEHTSLTVMYYDPVSLLYLLSVKVKDESSSNMFLTITLT